MTSSPSMNAVAGNMVGEKIKKGIRVIDRD